MSRRRRTTEHAGGHGWYVTFADLMALLMAFFVMIAAFSTMNEEKMRAALGSIREAFGVTADDRLTGIIERDGIPVRARNLYVDSLDPKDASAQNGPLTDADKDGFASVDRNWQFATTAASLRQALQALPEIAEESRHIVIEETVDGLSIQIMDQDGRSMFAEGSSEPFERIKRLMAAVTPLLRAVPNRIEIQGHTAAGSGDRPLRYGPWELSSDRANAARRLMEQNGMPSDRFASIAGLADTEPMFPDNPFLSANRRITIILRNEAPPVPLDGIAR